MNIWEKINVRMDNEQGDALASKADRRGALIVKAQETREEADTASKKEACWADTLDQCTSATQYPVEIHLGPVQNRFILSRSG